MLAWLAAWWIGCYVALRFGFSTPVPVSVIKLYMGIVTLSLLAYALADSERWADVRDPVFAFLTERRYQSMLGEPAMRLRTGRWRGRISVH